MSKTKYVCERCKYFKTRQGTGQFGECRRKPPMVNIQGDTIFPQVKPSLWCGEFQLDLENYHDDGRKIYQRQAGRPFNFAKVRSKAQLDAYLDGDPKWNEK